MKANFKQFPVYTSIRKDMVTMQDVSFLIANAIYSNIPGIMAHAVALKIYGGDGEVELTDEETHELDRWAEMFSGIIADSLKDYIAKHLNTTNHNE